VFELDEKPGTDQLELTWLVGEPDRDSVAFFRAHARRLRNLRDFVTTQAERLTSAHERWLILAYYEALVEALEYAGDSSGDTENGNSEVECDISANGEETCAASFSYDPLDQLGPKTYNGFVCTPAEHHAGESIDYLESQYQTIEYTYDEESDDTCLCLNDHLQACASFRPHYHGK